MKMYRNVVCLIIGIIAMVITACKDKNAVVIKGSLTNVHGAKTVYLLKPDTMQEATSAIVDSAAIVDGKFVLKFNAPQPEFYGLLMGGTRIEVIAKNGEEVNINMNLADTTGTYEISGSEDSKKLMELTKIQQYYVGKTLDLDNAYYGELAKARIWADSDAVMTKYDQPYESSKTAYGNALLKFIKENNSSISAFFAARLLDITKYEQEMIAYADSAKRYFPENLQVKKFVNDMMAIKPVSVGHTAPDFDLADTQGKPVRLSDYKGKYLMIDFWASWCKPCRHNNPTLVKIYAKFKDKGFDILGISLNVEKKNLKTAIEADKLTWRQVCEFKRFESSTVKLFKIRSIPYNVIIDPQGTIVAKNLMIGQLDAFLNKTYNTDK